MYTYGGQHRPAAGERAVTVSHSDCDIGIRIRHVTVDDVKRGVSYSVTVYF